MATMSVLHRYSKSRLVLTPPPYVRFPRRESIKKSSDRPYELDQQSSHGDCRYLPSQDRS